MGGSSCLKRAFLVQRLQSLEVQANSLLNSLLSTRIGIHRARILLSMPGVSHGLLLKTMLGKIMHKMQRVPMSGIVEDLALTASEECWILNLDRKHSRLKVIK